ncbi:MAG: hypothetical protein JWO71_4544 [Candidatus Acidoferrum typicum]|nr:hypothetical protein [Candidatus Acidoferrum typicum]
MTILFPISVLGTLIVVLAIRLLAQSGRRPAVTVDEYAKAREALDAVFVETAMIKRIFSLEDAEFVARSATPDVTRSFLNERKKLALHWFRRTRKQLAALMDLHLRLAGYTYDPSPGFELRLTAKYLTFVAVSNIVLLLVWLLGPFKATRSISYAIRVAGSLCTTFSVLLERVNPTGLSSGRQSLVH